MPGVASRGLRAARSGVLPLACALALGCAKAAPSPSPPAPSAPPATVASASASSSAAAAGKAATDGARVLALAPASGGSAVDKDLARIQKALEHNPAKVDYWVLLGRAWVRKAREAADPGYYLNARGCSDVALEIDPGNRMALDLRSLVLLNDHKFDDARDLAEQVLAKDKDDLLALTTLSDALLELGRFDEASRAAQRLNDLKPNLPSYSRASYLRWLQGDAAGAKRIIRQAVDAGDPKDPEPLAWVLVQAATLFWHEGDYDGADKGFDLALARMADYPPALVGKGRDALAKGDGAAATRYLEKAYAQSPLVETAWLLGDAKQLAGDEPGAAEAYASVVKHGRQLDGRTLALFYATKDRDHDEAVRLAVAERAIRDDLYTEDACAWALYRAGKLEEARAASAKATALGAKDARLLYHAGAIALASGDKRGEGLVREALKRNPHFDVTGAAEAARLLAGK